MLFFWSFLVLTDCVVIEVEVPAQHAVGIELNRALEIAGFVAEDVPGNKYEFLSEAEVGDRVVHVDGVLTATFEAALEALRKHSGKKTLGLLRDAPVIAEKKWAFDREFDWFGTLELLKVGTAPSSSKVIASVPQMEIAREEVLLRSNVTLASFGQRPTNKKNYPIIFDDYACSPKNTMEKAMVITNRGICMFAEKALAAKMGGAEALVIIDDEKSRLGADETFLKTNPKADALVVVSLTIKDGRAFRDIAEARKGNRLAARFVFIEENDVAASSETKDTGRSAAAAVRRAMKPSSFSSSSTPKKDSGGVLLTFRGGEESLSVVSLADQFGGAHFLSFKQGGTLSFLKVDNDCQLPPLSDLDFFVAIDLDEKCDNITHVAAQLLTYDENIAALFLPPASDTRSFLDPKDIPFLLNENTKVAFGLVSPAAANRLRQRPTTTHIAQVDARPRLLRTWRQLHSLRDPKNWPSDRRLRTRIYGALRRIVAPEGDEADPDQWAQLQALYHNISSKLTTT